MTTTADVVAAAKSPAPTLRAATLAVRPRPRLPVGWPLAAVLCFYPVWWVAGLAPFAFIIAAIPMTAQLVRQRGVRVPPGFAIWGVFLLWVVGSTVMLGINPPGTVAASVLHRLPSTALRVFQDLAATVCLLYAGNLGERLPQRRLVSWLAIFGATTVAGGFLGMVAPHLQITSPVESLLPGHIRANTYVQSLVHPAAAQLQNVLGTTTSARPAAPFGYTNTWGNCLTVLLIWMLVAVRARRGGRRTWWIALCALAIVPIIYSLNRGTWIGLVVLVGYLAVRMALLRHVRLLVTVVGLTVVVGVASLVTPLHSLVLNRLHHGQSNDLRTYTTQQSLKLATESPLVGYGTTRALLGSNRSITLGRTESCPRCGNAVLGENGEVWSVMICNGFVGVALYFGFFLYGAFRFRRDHTAVGLAGVAVMLVAIGYAFVYNAVGVPLTLYLLSYALLWRNTSRARMREAAVPVVRRPWARPALEPTAR